jgi:rod shape determining protein RodA
MVNRRSIASYFDFPLLTLVGVLLGAGLLTLYSSIYMGASAQMDVFWRQIIWLTLGTVAMFTAIFTPLKTFRRVSYIAWGVSIALLVLVLAMPVVRGGAGRWIMFMGFQIQPSEIAKLTTIMALARYLGDQKSPFLTLKMVVTCGVLVIVPTILVQQQPDLGTCLVILALLIPMLYWAGMPHFGIFALVTPGITVLVVSFLGVFWFLGWLAVLTLGTVLLRQRLWMLILVVLVNIGVGVGAPYAWDSLKPYQQKRVQAFLDPNLDPRGAGYQILQSQTAIGSGGLSGKGYLQGTQTHLRFLPKQHTDFIFSVLGEEFGFLGVVTVLSFFFMLIHRGIWVAVNAKNAFVGFCAIGITTVFLVHTVVNIGMTVGLLPVTGLPLPFLSYGGSALMVNMTMVGLLNNASAHRLEYS